MIGSSNRVRVAILACGLWAAGATGGSSPATAVSRGARLLAAAGGFRALALDDYRAGLERFASTEARTAFDAIDGALWPTVAPRTGWSYFFGTSVWTATGLESATPRVAFYHPWSDVYLATEWRLDGEEPRLVAASVLLGDWLRGDDATFELVPGWLRADEFAPAALARVAAEALRAFERASEDAATSARLAPWRPEDVELNRSGASLLLAAALRSAQDFAVARAGEPARLAALRRAAAETLRRVRAGELGRLAAEAPETLPATRRLAESLPAFRRPLLPIHALAVGAQRAFVFAGDPADGDLVLSLLYDESGGAPALRRLDLLTLSQAYRVLSSEEGAGVRVQR